MDTKTLQQLKKNLLKERALIESELKEIAKENPMIKGDWVSVSEENSDSYDTMDERAHAVTVLEERRAVEQSLELRLKEINDTLTRIDAGLYGICISCNSAIEERRLKARPVASKCVACLKKATLV